MNELRAKLIELEEELRLAGTNCPDNFVIHAQLSIVQTHISHMKALAGEIDHALTSGIRNAAVSAAQALLQLVRAYLDAFYQSTDDQPSR